MSSATRILSIPELLKMILGCATVMDMLNQECVYKSWRATIQSLMSSTTRVLSTPKLLRIILERATIADMFSQEFVSKSWRTAFETLLQKKILLKSPELEMRQRCYKYGW